MMNGDEDDVNLGRTLGYSHSCIRTRLKNNSGAGVNAESSVDMTFAASDPLTELVWSPHKGLSVKCADCSKADKKPFLLWNVGPSNMVPSPSQSIRFQENDEDKIVDGNLILSHGTFHVDGEVARTAILAQSASNGARPVIESSHEQNMKSGHKSEKRNTEDGVLPKHSRQNDKKIVDDDDKEVCSPQIVQMADRTDAQGNTGQLNQNPLVQGSRNSSFDMAMSKSLCGKLSKEFSTNCDGTSNEVTGGSQILAGVTTASEVHAEIQSRAHMDPLPKSPLQDETTKEAMLATEEENKKMMNMYSSKLPSLEKLECTAENDLHHLSTKEAYCQSEERLPRGSSVLLGTSPMRRNHFNGNFSQQRRGKSKALSDGNFSARFSNGEDDSHESVESCNSAGLLSKGKRRLKYEENLVFENKRLKQIDGSPASVSTVRNNSSFMNWISNMVKGFSKSNEEQDPSLTHANPKHASILQETIICSEHHDTLSRNMGFQNIFHSLYSQKPKVTEARVSRDNCSIEESRGLVHADKNNIIDSPISCPGKNGVSCEKFMSNDKAIPSMADASVHSGRPYMFSMTLPVQVDSVVELAENKASANPQCHGDSDGINSPESLGMDMIAKVRNENPDLASEGRPINDMSNKSNLFGSLWITRFSPKTRSSILNLDNSKQISSCCEAIEYPDYKAVSSQTQKNPDSAMKQKRLEARDSSNETSGEFLVKELQMFAANTECSVGFKEINGHNQQNSVLKLNSVLPSQTFKSSEAMASVFAPRLGALKHIIPLGSKNGATSVAATCFYCGKSGHSLGDCSEVTETELDHLLGNISYYVGAECPCLCIRCFQLDHWAAACPRGSSSRQQRVKKNTCFNVGNLKLLPIDERTSQFLEKEEHNKGAVCSGDKSCTNTGLRDPVINGDSFGQISSSSNETQKRITSNSRENNSGEFHNLHLTNHFSTHVINIPQGMFEAVRGLQMSRTDILKLMKSHVLMPPLEGFFLRLRLRKWEAGLGGTGYHVACITGQAGKAVEDLKKSISVDVGGIKCQVGSQYVSNHDFLEDEFMAWWCRTLRSGEKLPSKDDLESKFKQRIKLGF